MSHYPMIDLRDADDILDTLRDNLACAMCGSPDPARLGLGGCSDCRTFPRCVCGQWTGLEEPFAHEEGQHGA